MIFESLLMKKQHLVLYIIIIYCICLFCGCAGQQTAQETTLFCMDTVMQLRLYGDNDGAAEAEITAILQGLDAALSVTDEQSALSACNANGRSSDETVLALWDAAALLCARTGGAVDPTVYPVVRLWGFTTQDYRVPDEAEIADVLALVGANRVQTADGTLRLPPGMALDFGAFAKGYAGDLCRQALEARGVSGILTLGGNIQTVGRKPDGSDWVVGIADPDAPESYCLTLRVQGSRAVVTSGDYQRYFEQGGVRYCHIFDPATGCPVQNGLRSVTVVCDSGVTADGLSTALFVMGMEKAVEFWRQSSDFEAVFLDESGKIFVTEGLRGAAGGTFTVVER